MRLQRCASTWLKKNWPLASLCVFGTSGLTCSCFGFCPRFIDGVCADATASPGSHVGSQRHDTRIKFFGTRFLHTPRFYEKPKQTLQNQPQGAFVASETFTFTLM